jgi:hypothetical protein
LKIEIYLEIGGWKFHQAAIATQPSEEPSLDFCGKLPQSVPVSHSIRISDDLAEAAQHQAKLFHRSPPQQVEHWAAIGRVMEVALSYPAEQKVAESIGPQQIEAALNEVGTTEGIARAQAVIRKTSGTNVSDPK